MSACYLNAFDDLYEFDRNESTLYRFVDTKHFAKANRDMQKHNSVYIEQQKKRERKENDKKARHEEEKKQSEMEHEVNLLFESSDDELDIG